MRSTIAGVAFLLTIFMSCQPNDLAVMEGEFKNPGTEYRPLGLWTWLNGYVDTTQLIYELEQMKEKGMRGALIWDVGSLIDPEEMIPAGPAMLGDTSLQYFKMALDKAGELGLDLGWFASSSWNAGGPWVEEENGAVELLSSSQIVEGPGEVKVAVKMPEKGKGELKRLQLVTSMAIPWNEEGIIPSTVNPILLDKLVDQDSISWEVPDGKWEILSFFMNNSFQHLTCPSPNSDGLIIDHLSHQATKSHFDSILNRLSPIQTPENHLKFFMLDSYEVWPMTDWSPLFIESFVDQYGYDPVPYLPLLTGYQSDDSLFDARFRGDYHRLVSDMIIENHFAQSVEIADEHGFKMLSEAGHGGYARVDALKALGHSHIPMGEFWNRQRFWVTKEAASAAHIYGLKVVAAESLTGWNHWQQGPSDFKQLIDIAFCQGLNQVVFHTFDHQPKIAGKPGFAYHAGEHINVNTTWWDMARPFMDYLARCSYLLRQGNVVADACLYYGDQAPNLVPPDRIDPNVEPIFGDDQCLHCGKPKPVNPGKVPGYDYDYINAEIIINDLEVVDGRLVLPHGQSYRVLYLPDKEEISLEVLKKIKTLVQAGAVVVGPRPVRATSLKNYPECDLEVQQIAKELWGGKNANQVISDQTLLEVFTDLELAPDFQVLGIDNSDLHIDFIHRQTDQAEIYFISNSLEQNEHFSAVFRIGTDLKPQIWDPLTGLIQREVEYDRIDEGIRMEFTMGPLSSRFVVFTASEKKRGNDAGLVEDLQFAPTESGLSGGTKKLDLSEDWELAFDPQMGGPEHYHLDELKDWTVLPDEGINFYSGKASYQKSVNIDALDLADAEQVWLEFEDIQEMARVFVNDQEVGYVWTPPYRISVGDYLTAGDNEFRIEVINTWNNRLVGDARQPDKQPFTNTNVRNRFNAGKALLRSGIIGEASLHFVGKPDAMTDLSASFYDPDREYRPGAFWCWLNGNMTREMITKDLREMSEKGMGRAEIWDVAAVNNPDNYIPAGPQFLSDSSVALMKHAFSEGRKYGIEIGMVGSSGWNAGGTWVEPEWASKQLFFSETKVKGPITENIELPFPKVPNDCPKDSDGMPVFYKEVAVIAIPETKNRELRSVDDIIMLEGEIQHNQLSVDLPEGNWILLRFINSNNGQYLIVPSPKSRGLFIDFLDPESTKKHLTHILTRLDVSKDPNRSGGLAYIEFDSMELAEGISWTDKMPEIFKDLRGYDIWPYLPVLAGYSVGDDTDRFRYDWKKTVSDQLIHSHYETGRKFLADYGVKLVAEAGGPGPPTWSTCPVDALKALGNVSIPRGEFWVQHRHIFLIKEVASAAHIYGRRVVDAESFTTWRRWKDSPFDLKKLVDRAFCEGLNNVTFHTFASTAPEDGLPGRTYHAGSDINHANTWWNKSGPFMDYLSRCSYLLQQGLFVADACFYYGDQAPNFWPAFHVVPEKIIPESLGDGYDYDVVNSDVILNRMRVKDGKIVLPDGISYQVLVLPEQDDMPLDVMKKLEQLVSEGATIIGKKPARIPYLENFENDQQELNEIVERLWSQHDYPGRVIDDQEVWEVLLEDDIPPDFVFDKPGELDYIHRKTEQANIYFIRNKKDEQYSSVVSFRVDEGYPELWDPVTGKQYQVREFRQSMGRMNFELTVPARGSVFVVFNRNQRNLPVYEEVFPIADQLMTLNEDWEVTFTPGWGAPESAHFEDLISWTESSDPGIRYYSGTASYHKTIQLEADVLTGDPLFIDLGRVRDVAEVFVNGHSAGIVWNPPYRVDISKWVQRGSNELRVEVVNQWVNRLTGDMLADPEDRYCTTNQPYITSDDFGFDNWAEGGDETFRIQESGLMGPVVIYNNMK